ncbi:unnamed protein product [Brugia timori]|uniref:Uncharacterized protein n=1 Tax=Brugia timori TaxID=42155 RepID=A0A3P7VF25_9BILA|nr:unnamed protein product [Brugia timori]
MTFNFKKRLCLELFHFNFLLLLLLGTGEIQKQNLFFVSQAHSFLRCFFVYVLFFTVSCKSIVNF